MNDVVSCVNYKGLKIRVSNVIGKCPFNKRVNDEYFLEQVCPKNMCLALYHGAIPYLFTFLRGGRFAWLRDRNSVVIQCPNPNVSVTMNIRRPSNGKRKIDIAIIETKGVCPFGMKKGDSFNLNEDELKFCPQALDALFPYINTLQAQERTGEGKQPFKVACPGYPDYVIFEIISI